MNIKSIKARADELIAYCKPQYIRILIIMTIVGMIPDSLPSSGLAAILFFVVSILFIPFKHGYIVTSLKIVRNNFHELSDDDAFVGFKRFKELFFTYFLYELIVVGALVVLALIALVIAVVIGGNINLIGSILAVTAIATILITVATMLVGLYGFAFPYLLEKYGYTGMSAIKESFRFIKGHLLDLFKLELSYFGWVVLVVVVQILLAEVFSFLGTLGTVISSLGSGIVGLLTYLPQYYIAKAIFFEEIAYKRYPEVVSECMEDDDENQIFGIEYVEEQGDNDVY